MANAPDRSPRPEFRPAAADAPIAPEEAPSPVRIAVVAGPNAPAASARPSLRPTPSQPQRPVAAVIAIAPGTSALAVPRSLRPDLRPADLARPRAGTAPRTTTASVAPTVQRGRLCGQRGLAGDRLAPIYTGTGGCGIVEPILLREVDGIALSSPATINCDTARALQQWVRQSLVPEVGRYGGGVRSLRVVASYACRTRNNQPGARLSEHARGNAIDIAGIGLADGTELTVLTDWRTRREGGILRDLHRGACGPFGTVLGPESDRFHRDHFHFDVARHRGGPFCR
ncbi:extensin family protein [Roseicyclus sp.]|uniref:extensin-like domain-containing protein n=1 Tax=Roseicyclus sp. TaxID=1914329 RepID=UPI003F6C761F